MANCKFGCGLKLNPTTGLLEFLGDFERGLECDPDANGGEGAWFVKVDGCTIKHGTNGLQTDIPLYAVQDGVIQNGLTTQYTSVDGRVYNNQFCLDVDNTTCANIFLNGTVYYGVGVLPVAGSAQIRWGVEVSTDNGTTWSTLNAYQTDLFTAGWQQKYSYSYPTLGALYPPGPIKSECYRLWVEVLSGTVTWVDADVAVHYWGLGIQGVG